MVKYIVKCIYMQMPIKLNKIKKLKSKNNLFIAFLFKVYLKKLLKTYDYFLT
jgi:hypothetical protein